MRPERKWNAPRETPEIHAYRRYFHLGLLEVPIHHHGIKVHAVHRDRVGRSRSGARRSLVGDAAACIPKNSFTASLQSHAGTKVDGELRIGQCGSLVVLLSQGSLSAMARGGMWQA